MGPIHGLPLAAFEEECAKVLGNAVGETLMVEQPVVDGSIQRSFVRARVMVNLNDPLVTEILVPREEKEPAHVMVKYERLQNFCYGCGRIGHEVRLCKSCPKSDELPKEACEFGSWLRAPSIRSVDNNLICCKEGWMEFQNSPAKPMGESFNCRSPEMETSVLEGPSNQEDSPLVNAPEDIQLGTADKEINFENPLISRDLHNSGIGEIILLNDEKEKGPMIEDSPHVNINVESNFMKDARKGFGISRPNLKEAQGSLLSMKDSPLDISPSPTKSYFVDFPNEELDLTRAVIPVNGFSPLSAITKGINAISLKRPLESEHDDSGRPTKRCLFQNGNDQTSSDTTPQRIQQTQSQVGTRRSFRNLKKSARSRRIGVNNISSSSLNFSNVGVDSIENLLIYNQGSNESNSTSQSENAGGWMGPTTGSP